MSDHVVVNVSGLTTMEEVKKLGILGKEGTSSENGNHQELEKHKFSFLGNEEEEIEKKACRICHEDDFVKNLEAPCACNGSLKVMISKPNFLRRKRSTIYKQL